jgi:hypothetical protein
MNAFKNQAKKIILDESINLILTQFDKNDKCNKIREFTYDNYTIVISKNCFPPDSNFTTYFEDYSVSFNGNIENKNISSYFYLEWKDNELIPSTNIWDKTIENHNKIILKINK